eukprot:gene16333-22523_t
MAKLSLDMTGRLKNRRSSVGVVPSHYIRTSSDVLAGLVSEGIASLGDARRTKELWPKSPHAPGSPSASIMKLAKEPSDNEGGMSGGGGGVKLSLILEHVDDWTFDIFELQRATNGRTLSVLAFNLFKRADITSRFGLDESKLARFLTRVEDGYPPHPYHCREHAADVLRTLHGRSSIPCKEPCATQPGLREIINSLQGAKNPGCSPSFFRSPPHAGQEGQDSRLAPTRDAMSLFFVYLAAIIHDFEHRGVNNQFLVQTGDPLALLYNDMSPMENHHISASFMLLKEERYNFMAMMPKKVWQVLRTQVIELVLATDMKQHFSLVSMFESNTPLNGGRPSSKASSLARQCNPLVSNNGCSNFMTRSVSNTTLTGLLAHSWQGASTNGLLTSLPTSPIPSGHLDMLESLETVEAPQERSKLVLNSIPHERHMFGALQRGPVGLPRRMNKVDSTNGSTHSRQSSTQMGMRYSHNADSSPIVMPSDLATIRSPALSTTNNLCSPAPEPPLPTHQAPMDPEFMTLVWKIALKCADLSNLANSRPVAKKWVLLLEEEMFRQGDKERAASLPVSALMDRNKAGVTKSQPGVFNFPGFFNVVAIPLFSSFAQCFPSASAMLEGAQDNLAMWVEAEKKAEQEKEAVKLKRVEVQAAAHLKKIADMADSMAGPG